MKTLVLVITSGLLIAAGVFLLKHHNSPGSGPTLPETAAEIDSTPVEPDPDPAPLPEPLPVTNPAPAPEAVAVAAATSSVATATPVASASSLPFQQALDTLVSSQATYDQKQAAWGQIQDAGRLDQAIAELEQRASANPNAAEYPATLGQAYLHKAGTVKDIREQGILGMKADQTFDAAMNIDPANWEAGFWKAVAMSYWPPQLNKGQEVIERFVELIKLQENQLPQPQFAQTYFLLGEQYQKQGYADYARQIWQRGAILFPNDSKLLEKANEQAAETQAAAAR